MALMVRLLDPSPRALRAALDGLEATADAVLDAWGAGDGISDTFLAVHRVPGGYVVHDGEAAQPRSRRATREEARDFVVAILAAST
jgi:hypothetical protein